MEGMRGAVWGGRFYRLTAHPVGFTATLARPPDPGQDGPTFEALGKGGFRHAGWRALYFRLTGTGAGLPAGQP